MATIITVHGTFASGPDTGEKWWQHTSPFETHMSELLEADEGELKFEPFIWSGLNSETSRRKAGHHLFDKMKTLDGSGEPYSVIGHSHGGSVISASLMESAKRKNSHRQPEAMADHRHAFYQDAKRTFIVQPSRSVGQVGLCGADHRRLDVSHDYPSRQSVVVDADQPAAMDFDWLFLADHSHPVRDILFYHARFECQKTAHLQAKDDQICRQGVSPPLAVLVAPE